MKRVPFRTMAKAAAFLAATLLASPCILLAWLERALGPGEDLFVLCGQVLALLPGIPGSYLRAAYYRACLPGCSWQVRIGFGSFFSRRGAVLGRHVSVGSYCVLGRVAIGDRTLLASRVSMPSGRHQHVPDQAGMLSDGHYGRVTIGPDCWIGEGAIVMADVGAGCVVAAGAVVFDAIEAGWVASGNPARPLRQLHRPAVACLEG